ncbi:hypothetical protein NECID01_2048 [Nematocida sp. AWRm77]|nr:hypothetical protein NECID01_2048 [Nematocida sp. AWRm77]
MKKTAAYLTISVLTMFCFCTSTIEVNFKLASEEEPLTSTIPRGAFKEIDRQTIDCASYAEQGQASSALKEKCEISLSNISTHEQYGHFKAFWETDLAVVSAEDEVLSQYQADLTPDLFDSFLFTADFLEIQGEYAKCFAKNMVRYGLLGKHSKDITENSRCKEKDLAYDTFETMLPVFLRQAGFDSRTITHPSEKKKTLLIEEADAWANQIGDEYAGLPQEERSRIVLYSELAPESSQEKERNEAALAWLLSNMGGSSVDIHYFIEISSEDIADLSQVIEQFTKENEKGTRVYVEGLSLMANCTTGPFSLHPALQLVPDLSRLELFITSSCTIPNGSLSSLFSALSSCKALKVLEITGHSLESAEVSSLVESLPATIEQLSFFCKPLEDTAIDGLKKCSRLEILEMHGESQPSAVVQVLVSHLSSLKELIVWGNVLELAAAESFKACTKLEKLEIWGDSQPSAAVQTLLRHLPLLKTLIITVYAGDLALADTLRNYPNLRSLTLKVEQYTPGFLARYLEDPLPSLTFLSLSNSDTNPNINCSEEDNRAVEEAKSKNILIFLN